MDTTQNHSRSTKDIALVGTLALISLAALIIGLRGRRKNKISPAGIKKGSPSLVEQFAPVK